MVPEEYANTFYFRPRHSAQERRLRNQHEDDEQQQEHQHQQGGRGEYCDYIEEEERANMTGIVRANVEKYPVDPSTYPHIVETKRPKTLVEQRIEFWKHPISIIARRQHQH
jgi:hypothetical protein